MNLQEFRRFEKELGHPPTQKEVSEYENKHEFKPDFVQLSTISLN